MAELFRLLERRQWDPMRQMLCAANLLAAAEHFSQLETHLRQIVSQLPESLAAADRDNFAAGVHTLPRPLRKVEQNVFVKLSDAVQDKLEIEIHYSDASGTHTVRTIRPLQIINDRGELYCLAHCTLRDGIRVFALSRIQNAEVSSTQFEPVDPGELDGYLEQRFGAFYTQEETISQVQVRFDSRDSYIVRDKMWPAGFEVLQYDEGVELKFESGNLVEVARWLLSFGAVFQIIQPDSLRRIILHHAESLLNKNTG